MLKTLYHLATTPFRRHWRRRRIVWAYRLFLDREPESAQVVADKARRLADTRAIRQEFLESEESRATGRVSAAPTLTGLEPPMVIDRVSNPEDLCRLFGHIQETWTRLGETEPYWSVVASDAYRLSKVRENLASFRNDGRNDLERIRHILARNGIDIGSLRSCLEYGCGVGRVTRWLAEEFEQVYGCDISSAHLRLAEAYVCEEKVQNIEWRWIREIADIRSIPKVDFIYSLIVLQHNPPPLIELILRCFFTALSSKGVAIFQVPTYRQGYRFRLSEYLDRDLSRNEMEMHVFPQAEIFRIAREEGASILEILEDGFTGMRNKEVSNTFLVRKD